VSGEPSQGLVQVMSEDLSLHSSCLLCVEQRCTE